jgi:CRISPR/Cas system-associated exonuclease Cas4 (RecB family)
MGINSKLRRCFYERDTAEYILEYILKFLETYKNERKFFRLISNDAHEGTLELVKYMDNALHDFLLEILTKYFDEKTLIVFLSDHGGSLAGAYELILSEDKNFEKVLGFLYIILPKNSSYNEIVEYNEQRFVTPYDIFGTYIVFDYM